MGKTCNNITTFLFQLAILFLAYLVCYNNFSNSPEIFETNLIILLALWILTEWLTQKYKVQYYQQKLVYIMAPFFNAIIISYIITLIVAIATSNLLFNLGLVLQSLSLYLLFELVFFALFILLIIKLGVKGKELKTDIQKYIQDDLKIESYDKAKFNVSKLLSQTNLFYERTVNKLYKADTNTYHIDDNNIKIIKHETDLNDKKINYHICILDKRINDLELLNESLRNIYEILMPGGYLFITYKELNDFEQEFFSSSNNLKILFKKAYYYLVLRGWPKIPYLNFIYRFLFTTKCKVISRAEILGRLYYCGFDVETELWEERKSYLLARKTKKPSENPNPSFYPIITLNRVSINGTIIKIHKLRSMYPYSEFIQKKVYEDASLTTMGKFGNDFRITKIGKFCRKFWLDELPQIIDLFRGKIKLVGIRAMSQHYFSLYPFYYKDLYYKVKPGIISPIFDETTSGFDDIVKIEQEYLEQYLKNPLKTDIKYFIITLKQIIKGVRSS